MFPLFPHLFAIKWWDNMPWSLFSECWILSQILYCRLLRVPWTAKRSNQSVLKEISPEYSLERLILKLKLQYFSHVMQWIYSLEKTLTLEKTEGRRRRDDRGYDWVASPTQWTWARVSSRNWWWTGKPGMLQSMESQRFGHDWATELIWTSLSSFTFIKRLCSFTLLSANKLLSSAYLRLLIFLLAILIPCDGFLECGSWVVQSNGLWVIQPSISHNVPCIEVK